MTKNDLDFNDSLNEIRSKIDKIDLEIFNLLVRRSSCIEQVRTLKCEYFGAKNSNEFKLFIKPNREDEMLQNIYSMARSANCGYTPEFFVNIWRNIISASNFIEQDLVIGVTSQTSKTAAYKYYGFCSKVALCESNDLLFSDFQYDKIHIAILPSIEFSSDIRHKFSEIFVAKYASFQFENMEFVCVGKV